MQLRIPGPTPCPPEVLEAMGKQMIDHRSQSFSQLMERLTGRLEQFFFTKHDVYLLTASGTGSMEAAIVNTLSPGDKVMALSCGYFGNRFAAIAQAYGAEVKKLDFPWGEAVDPGVVRQALKTEPGIKAVLVVHNETSTGVTNPLKEICRVVKEADKLLLVDAVSSLGALELRADEWGIDVAITASQKAWMTPPGLAMISFSPRAWQAYETAKMPRFYWDLGHAKKFAQKWQTPWTPAVSICYAMDKALELMAAEGIEAVWARHAKVAERARQGVKALGLTIFPKEAVASNTVTAINAPPGLDPKQLRRILREERGIVLAGGQGNLEEKVFRIGHLGWVTEKDIAEVLRGLEVTLPEAGFVHV
ncbi:MAG: alanine--glyoxylate aminotransferase family protein [Chloroflexota bacterium]